MQFVSNPQERTAEEIVALFDKLFRESHNTVLRHAKSDPEYLPCDHDHPNHRILFAHGFVTSALHEISHWCIAGKRRLLLPDYGYWYEADGRSSALQEQFFNFEAKNQGLEWILAMACQVSFHVSTDNLDSKENDRLEQNRSFAAKVLSSALNHLEQGLPPRAQMFVDACLQRFGTKPHFDREIENLKTRRQLPNH